MWILPQTDPREMPALALAYIGDAVFELYVRGYLLSRGLRKVQNLHVQASGMVRASRQACFLHALEPLFTPEELDVAKRGRNAKSGHIPKNADMAEYRLSTGFEALLGYLFLHRREERIAELMEHLFRLAEADADN
ncbi:MAG: ribonuclease III domain-containing protein [Clostridia bacterium]|nr:ribonuclease III domain-containing protein [Clostridia bacterium]